jgi:CRISPR-associated protein Cas2
LLYQRVKRNAPKKGLIQILTITEKQYANIKYITGLNDGKIIDSESRLIIL